MRASLALVALLLPTTVLALDGGLPLTTLDDGWVRVEADEPVTFRWTVDDPFVGVVEAEQASGQRSSMDTCVWPDSGGGPPRARLRVEVAAPEAAVALDLGQPAEVQLLGVLQDQGSLLAAFTAVYSCTALGAGGTAEVVIEWWSAVRLAPSLAVVEHRRQDHSSSAHWYAIGPQLGIAPALEAQGGRLKLGLRVQPYLPDGRDGEVLAVRWPVGEAPSCLHPTASRTVRVAPKVVGTFIEVATPESKPGSLGRLLVDPFTSPMAFAVELQPSDGTAEAFVRLPLFTAAPSLAGYAGHASVLPSVPMRDPQVEPRLEGGAYLATSAWPEARVACAAELEPGVLERYAQLEWAPLVEGRAGRVGLLSIPCFSWRNVKSDEGRRASWVIRSGLGPTTPALAVSSCGGYQSPFESYDAPRVAVRVEKDHHRVRLSYQPPIDPDWLRADPSARLAAGDTESLDARLVATRGRGGVAAVTVDLGGRVEVEPAASRWCETWTGPGAVAELEWTGERFTAMTTEMARLWSTDGVTWSSELGTTGAPAGQRVRPGTPDLPAWVHACPDPGSADPRARVAANGRGLVVTVSGYHGKMTAATSCADAAASQLPGCYFANAVIWTGEKFLVAGDGPCKDGTGRLWSSSDGTSWQAETVPLGGPLTHLAASPDMVVVGGWGRLLSAPVAAARAPERDRRR